MCPLIHTDTITKPKKSYPRTFAWHLLTAMPRSATAHRRRRRLARVKARKHLDLEPVSRLQSSASTGLLAPTADGDVACARGGVGQLKAADKVVGFALVAVDVHRDRDHGAQATALGALASVRRRK